MEIRRSADSMILTAKAEGERKGKREGKREGLKEGLKEGLQKGLKEGRGLERAAIIKNMYETGSAVAQIVKSTKLPEKDVRQILGLSQNIKKRNAK